MARPQAKWPPADPACLHRQKAHSWAIFRAPWCRVVPVWPLPSCRTGLLAHCTTAISHAFTTSALKASPRIEFSGSPAQTGRGGIPPKRGRSC